MLRWMLSVLAALCITAPNPLRPVNNRSATSCSTAAAASHAEVMEKFIELAGGPEP